MRQSGQPCLSITVSLMISLQPFTQQIHPSSLSALLTLFPLALLSSSSSILSVSAFSKTSSYRLNVFFWLPLICGVARPCGVESCPVWSRQGIMRQVLLPQPPSRTEILALSLFHQLCISVWDRLFTCRVKIRSGPKGHTCFCCVVITVSLSLFPSLSLSVSSQDAPVEDSSIEVVEPERGSVN